MKAWFAKDRWQIIRISHWRHKSDLNGSARISELHIRNRYNGKVKTVELDGHWEGADFPGLIYRGQK